MSMGLAWRKINFHRDHRWAGSHLSEYVDGELPARQSRRLAAHEGLCPECRRAIESLRRLVRSLPRLRHEDPDLADRTARSVSERIERERTP
jgi:anti-sigma factor RsiW